jgi:hypothetical protein
LAKAPALATKPDGLCRDARARDFFAPALDDKTHVCIAIDVLQGAQGGIERSDRVALGEILLRFRESRSEEIIALDVAPRFAAHRGSMKLLRKADDGSQPVAALRGFLASLVDESLHGLGKAHRIRLAARQIVE